MKKIFFETGRVLGVITMLGVIGLWLVLLFYNPYGYQGFTARTGWMAGLMIFLAAIGLLLCLAGKPYWMAFIFAVMFTPVGLYTMGTPGIYRWVGILELIFAGAALLMIAARQSPGQINTSSSQSTPSARDI